MELSSMALMMELRGTSKESLILRSKQMLLNNGPTPLVKSSWD
jgi:hypothetical protein